MKRRSRREFLSTAIAAPALLAGLPAIASAVAGEITVASPNDKVQFHLVNNQSKLLYRIALNNREVIEPSQLSIILDGVDLSHDVTIAGIERFAFRDSYPARGVHSLAVNNCRGARISITHASSKANYTIEARAFNDGIAFRFIVPGVRRCWCVICKM